MFVKSNVSDNRVALWLRAFSDKPETEVFVYGNEVFEVPDDDGDVQRAIAERRIVEVEAPAPKTRKPAKNQEPNSGKQPDDNGTPPIDPNAPTTPPVVAP